MSEDERGPGGQGPEHPDLDLDLARGADAQVMALFREGLRPGPEQQRRVGADLRGIEKRAKRRRRRGQVVTSGVVTMAAALAAVAVIVAPWSAPIRSGVPARPSPSVSATDPDTSIPRVTKWSLLRPSDLEESVVLGRGLMPKPWSQTGQPEDKSGLSLVGGVCVDDVLTSQAPGSAWTKTFTVEAVDKVDPGAVLTERVMQWEGKPEQASAIVAELRSQLAECSAGPGLEGRSATEELVGNPPRSNVPTLVTTALDGQGHRLGQGVVAWGDAVVMIDVAFPANGSTKVGTQEAVQGLLHQAVKRMAGQQPPDGKPGSELQWGPDDAEEPGNIASPSGASQ